MPEAIDATAELTRYGIGFPPEVAPKNPMNQSKVRGAKSFGGLSGESAWLCRPVSTIQKMGMIKMMPTAHASKPRRQSRPGDLAHYRLLYAWKASRALSYPAFVS